MVKNGGLSSFIPAVKDRRVVFLEVNPPRGAEISAVLERYCGQNSSIDCYNVTDGALAKLRMAAVGFAALLKLHSRIEVAVNITCRDRNSLALQADLLAACAWGIRSVIPITGDSILIGDHPKAKAVFEMNSFKLMELVSKLNSGEALNGASLSGNTDFTCGGVINCSAINGAKELLRVEKKIKAGATYFLTQPVFCGQRVLPFFKDLASLGVDVLVGLMPIKDRRTVEFLDKIPGLHMPEDLRERLLNEPQNIEQIVDLHLFDVVEKLAPFVAGFHVISGSTPNLALQFCTRLAQTLRR